MPTFCSTVLHKAHEFQSRTYILEDRSWIDLLIEKCKKEPFEVYTINGELPETPERMIRKFGPCGGFSIDTLKRVPIYVTVTRQKGFRDICRASANIIIGDMMHIIKVDDILDFSDDSPLDYLADFMSIGYRDLLSEWYYDSAKKNHEYYLFEIKMKNYSKLAFDKMDRVPFNLPL